MPVTIGAAASAASGLISGITGLFQNHRANQLEKANARPTYTIPQEVMNNQAIAQQYATQGLPQAQYQQAMQNIGRNQNTALSAAEDRRGGLATIGALQQGSNDAALNLGVADAKARMNNISNLMKQNLVMGDYRDKAWGWNSQQKYLENAAAIRALRGSANTNFGSAANGLLSAGAIYGYGKSGTTKPTGWTPPVTNDLFTGNNAVGNIIDNRAPNYAWDNG